MVIYIGVGILFLLLSFLFLTYNNLVQKRNRVEEAFSTMDVYLKKRWDLIPSLVKIVKEYAKHEKQTLKEVIELRNQAYSQMDLSEKVEVNNQLSQKIPKLIALEESYPNLKASDTFQEFSKQLAKVEEDLANARKYYNGTVRIFNNKIEMFPSNLVSKIFGFKVQKMFEATSFERENVSIELEEGLNDAKNKK